MANDLFIKERAFKNMECQSMHQKTFPTNLDNAIAMFIFMPCPSPTFIWIGHLKPAAFLPCESACTRS